MTSTSEQLFSHVLDTLYQRGSKYGHPYPQHKRIGELWSAYLGYPVTANQVAMCMALVKISRAVESPEYQDNYADALGYISISKTCQDAMSDSGLDWQE